MNLKISHSLYLAFGLVLLLMITMSSVGWWQASKADTITNEVAQDDVPGVIIYLKLLDSLQQMELSAFEYLSGEDDEREDFQGSANEFRILHKQLVPLESGNQQDKNKMERIAVLSEQYISSMEKNLFAEFDPTIAAKSTDLIKEKAYRALHQMEENSFDPLEKILRSSAENEANDATSALKLLTETMTNMKLVLLITTSLAVCIGIGIAWSLSRSITGRLDYLVSAASDIAKGNLTNTVHKIDKTDEISTLTNSIHSMQASLRQLISAIANVSSEVKETSDKLDNSSQQVLEGSQAQASKADLIATSAEQMSVTIKQVAMQSSEASLQAKEAGNRAHTGGQIMLEMVESAHSTSHMMQSMSDGIAELGKRSDEIGKVIKVITDIANQTNLLALNAAIEAARAGEYGRGFSVVAEEVRGLAERTTNATQEVSELINAIQTETQKAIANSIQSNDLVQQGASLSEQSKQALDEIVSQTSEVQAMISSIATATEQQTAVTREIASDITYISDVAGKSVDLSSESAQSSQQLAEKVEKLDTLVGEFRLA